MDRTRKILKAERKTVATYSILLATIVSLWFMPLIVHIRDEYRPYNETLTVPPTGYDERTFQVYRPWETDLRLTGKLIVTQESLWVPQAKTIRFLVLDWDSYNKLASGSTYNALYRSGLVATLGFDIPLPQQDHGEVRYMLVFQNPSNQSITLTYDAGINFEKALLGYPYMQWISKLSILVLLIAFVYWRIHSRLHNKQRVTDLITGSTHSRNVHCQTTLQSRTIG